MNGKLFPVGLFHRSPQAFDSPTCGKVENYFSNAANKRDIECPITNFMWKSFIRKGALVFNN